MAESWGNEMFGWKRGKKGVPGIIARNDGAWFLLLGNASETFESDSPDILPEALLKQCVQNAVKRARILVPADPAVLEIDLADDLEPEEKHSAMAWELASVTGSDPEKSRIAAVDSSSFNFGGSKRTRLCAVFSRSTVSDFKKQLAGHGVKFEGISSLQLAVTGMHLQSRTPMPGSLLFVRNSSCFAFIPGGEGTPPLCRNIPIGMSGAQSDTREWADRLKKRLTPVKGGNIRFIFNSPPGDALEVLKRELQCRETRDGLFPEYLEELRAVAVENDIFVREQPRKKDPRTPGTWIAVIAILLTTGLLTMQCLWNLGTREFLKRKIERKTVLDAERKRYASQLDNLKKEISTTIRTYRLLESHRRIDENFLYILKSLNEIIPKYTRLNEIRQKGNTIIITGSSYSQSDIVKFGEALAAVSKKHGIRVEPDEIQSEKDQREKKFSFRLTGKQ